VQQVAQLRPRKGSARPRLSRAFFSARFPAKTGYTRAVCFTRCIPLFAALICAACATTPIDTRDAEPPPATAQPTPALSAAPPAPTTDTTPDAPPNLPGVHLNVAERYVDLGARISPRAGDWLELVACAGRSLEHESLVTIDALPSHVHLALLLLNLEPGKPQTWRQDEAGSFTLEPAGGAAVEAYFLLEGEPRPIPAHEWVVDQQTGEPMPPAKWLFAGSRFVEIDGKPVYAADLNGPVVTLVHFGDEVAAPASTSRTNRDDQQQWNAAPGRVPPAGMAVTLRLVPADAGGDAGAER